MFVGEVAPASTAGGSYRNHLLVRFTPSEFVPENTTLTLTPPAGFSGM